MQLHENHPHGAAETSEPPFTGLFNDDERARLPQARVSITGLGNIGSFAAPILARQGIGFIRLIDRDVVEQKNLANQAYCGTAHVGRTKVDCIAELIRQINPAVQVEPIASDLEDVPLGQFADVDLCLGALDSLRARQVLANEAALPQGVPVIDGGSDADGAWLGRVQVLFPASSCLECAWGVEHYKQLTMEMPCGGAGSPAVAIPATQAPALLGATVGSAMAAEAIKILVGRTARRSFEVAFDLANRRWLTSRLQRAAGCRFDHRVVVERLTVDVPFPAATVGHLLEVVRARFAGQPVRLQFRRRVFDHGAFGQSRFATCARLESYAGCRLARLGLTAADRVRVDGEGESAFLVFRG